MYTNKRAYLVSDGDGDGIIETGEEIVWHMVIWIKNPWGSSSSWTDVVVKDRLAAELEFDSINIVSKGTVENYTTGKSEKVHLTWYVGTLAPGESATLNFTVSTDINPGGKQEYSEPDRYELNSGPVMKYKVNGKRYSEEMPSIWITVHPQN